MADYKQLFIQHMIQEGIKYSEVNDHAVKVVYSGDNLQTIKIIVIFDEDGDPLVSVRCWEIANFKDKLAEGYIATNKLNSEYRWVKYYLDKDYDVVASIDAYVDEATCGSECLSLVRRMVNIIDDSYPVFMRAIYGGH